MNIVAETWTGKIIDLDNLKPSDIDIVDISHALSNLCRWNGHGRYFSVAEHSVIVTSLVPQELKIMAALHDGSEAYLGDVVSPVKAQSKGYMALEEKLQSMIYEYYCGRVPTPIEEDYIHAADIASRAAEAKVLLKSRGIDIPSIKDHMPIDVEIKCLPPMEAKLEYLELLMSLNIHHQSLEEKQV